MVRRFVDIRCHLDFPSSSGGEEASLQRATQAGVGKIIVPATEAENLTRVQALVEKYQPLYAALRLHPGMLEERSGVSLDQLQQALERRPARVMAVGEIYLDLFGDDPQFERQQWLLDEQLKLAKHYDLLVIFYSRCIHDKLAIHLKRHDLSHTDVVHSLSGSLQQAEWFVQLGYRTGIGGTITYPRVNKTRGVIVKLPLASLLLETDAPNTPLSGSQGKPSCPKQAARVFDVPCELRPEPGDGIAEVLLSNTHAVFSACGWFTPRRQHPAVGA